MNYLINHLAFAVFFALMAHHLAAGKPASNETPLFSPQDADSATLTLISSTLYANECCDVVADGEFCYVIEERPGYTGQIKVLDIHNPADPFLYAATNIPNHPWTKHPYFGRNISKNEDYLVVSYDDWRTSHAHLAIFDVSEPSLPVFLDSIYLGSSSYPLQLDTEGWLAFVYVYNYLQPERSGIISVDFTLPQSPIKRDTILSDYLSFSLGENYLYTYDDDTLNIYTFDSLGYMIFEGTYQFGNGNYIAGIHSSRDSFAFIVYLNFRSTMMLSVLDVSDPANPYLITEDSLPSFESPWVDKTTGDDSILYYTQDTLLCAVDISNPTAPMFLSASTFPSPCYSLFLRRDLLFSAHNTLGLRITEVHDPASPHIIGSYQTNGWVYGISLDHPFAYVAAGGLAVVNVSDPHNPAILGIYGRNLLKLAYDVTRSDNLLIVSSDSGIVLFDVGNPYVPIFQSYLPLSYARRVLAFDTLLFAANPFLHIIDCSHPGNPQILYSDDSLYLYINDFGMHDGLLCIAGVAVYDTFPFFCVYDIQDPANPKIVGALDVHQTPLSFAIRDTLVYVSNDIYSQVINIADPSNPFIVSTFTLSDVNDMETLDDRLFCIGKYQSGSRGMLSVYDLSDAVIPHQIASVPAYGAYYYNKISVMNNIIYCCNREGLAIYEFSETGLFQETPEEPLRFRVTASPNPCATLLHIQLTVSNINQEIRIQVFDVSGRLVKQLIPLPGNRGNHIHLQWNGTDEKQEQVSAGTYFLKIQQGSNSLSKKIIKIK